MDIERLARLAREGDESALSVLQRARVRRNMGEPLCMPVALPDGVCVRAGTLCDEGIEAAAARWVDQCAAETATPLSDEERALLIRWALDGRTLTTWRSVPERCQALRIEDVGIECDTILPCWVTAYRIQRCYGGPEEGGWWFDAWEVIETVKVDRFDEEAIDEAGNRLFEEHAGPQSQRERRHAGFDPYGREEIMIEERPGQYETRERPYYE